MDCISYINDLKIEIDMLKDSLQDCKEEREYINISRLIKSKEELINKYKDNLSKLSLNSIEYRLYFKILNRKNPTQAVKEVADENYMNDIKPNSIKQIWNYYKNLKKSIKLQ